jgi:hypothetical protein
MAPVTGTPVALATGPGSSLVVSYGTEGVDWNPGDSIFILAIATGASTSTFAAVTDWDLLKSERTSTIAALALYHRIMVTGDPTSMTILTIGSSRINFAVPWVDPDLDGTDAIDVIAAAADNTATSDATLTLTSITAGTSKRLYAVYGHSDNAAGSTGTGTGRAAFTHPGDMTELFDADTDTGQDGSLGVSYLDAVTGASGAKVITCTPNSLTNQRGIGFMISVNPSAGGGTDATVDADADDAVADGVAVALVHSVSTGSDQTVTVPAPALGVDGIVAPEVSASSTVTSPAATGLGQAPISENAVSAEVTVPVARAVSVALVHSVSGSGGTEQTSPVADAVPAALVHAVQAGATVTVPETANAVSVALVHTVSAEVGAIVTAVPALAVGFMSGPLVDDGVADDDTVYWVETIPSMPALPELGE